MPSETTDTLELPTTPEHPAERYVLRRGHCVVEVSLRLLGVRLIRARLRARGGDLVVTGSPPAASIQVDLLARPVRVAPPVALLLRRIPRRRRLSFAAVDVDLPTGTDRAPLDGEITTLGSVVPTWRLPLTARIVPSDDATMLLAAQGPIRPLGTKRGGFAFIGRSLWLDAAAEFAR